MAKPKSDIELMRNLLEFCDASSDAPMTDIDEDLAAEGVNVTAFLTRMRSHIQKVTADERTTRLQAARAKLARDVARPRTHRYNALNREALVAEIARRRTTHPAAAAFHRNFDQMTDEDMRTFLEDQDEGDGDA